MFCIELGMDGFIIGAVPMKKNFQDKIMDEISDVLEDQEIENEKDEAVKLFKQKIRRLEKAAKAGQLDVAEKTGADGGVWLNNLDSLNLREKEEKKKTSNYPGLNINNPPNIVIPSPIEGYEERIAEMVRKEQKNQEEILSTPNEDNVLKYITSEIDLSPPPSDWNENQSGIKASTGIQLTQSVARDLISSQNIRNEDGSFDTTKNVPRDMLLSRRGYQLKKLENLKAGYSKKVSFALFSAFYLSHPVVFIFLPFF